MLKTKSTYLRVASLGLLLSIGVVATGAMLKTSNWSRGLESRSPAADQQTDPMRNIRFTVYDVGIYPAEMKVDAGRLSIVFDDRTGKHSGFVVERIAGNGTEQVVQIRATRDHWRTRAQVRLVPGRYRVFVSDRPEIRSTLIVNP